MRFYPAGETIAYRLLGLPLQRAEWVITGARASEVIAAGFQPQMHDQTRFVHPESGDIYQLARRRHYDPMSDRLEFHCDPAVTLEHELATRPLTILAMAEDGDELIDPFGAQEDVTSGVLRHVTPDYVHAPQNLLITAVWAARLRIWGFRVAHATFRLMRKMVASGASKRLPAEAIGDAVIQAAASPRPSEFFRVLHRCGALKQISRELDALFDQGDQSHAQNGLPQLMHSLDRVAADTDNVSRVLRRFYQLLGNQADSVFSALGLAALAVVRR